MAAAAQEDDGLVQGINVTPLVDVCLVLLVIMMVTAKAIVSPQQVPLDLPKAAMSTEVPSVFKVEITKEGDVSVDGVALEKVEDLLEKAKAAHDANPQLRVSIRADASAVHGKVMRVVDLLKQAGVAKIAFASVQTEKEPGAVQN